MATDQIKFTPFSYFTNSHNGNTLGVEVTKASGGRDGFEAYIYRCHLVEDNDGAPTCYGLDNPVNVFANVDADAFGAAAPMMRLTNLTSWPHVQKSVTPLENRPNQRAGLANATNDHLLWSGQPFYWAALFAATESYARVHRLTLDKRPFLKSTAPDKNAGGGGKVAGKYPVVQPPWSSAAPGYYISTSGQLANGAADPWDPARYWDASKIPYAVYANRWADLSSKVNIGDFGFAIRDTTGTYSEFAFRDTGTTTNVGECSRKLCRTLAPTPDNQGVYNEDFVSFLVFPGSGMRAASVEGEIKKLNAADNRMEVPLFLAMGSNFRVYKAFLAKLYATKGKTNFPFINFLSFWSALRAKGLQEQTKGWQTGLAVNQLVLAEKSVNL